jgi:hypothetical protein
VTEEAEKRQHELMAFVLFTEDVAFDVHGVTGNAEVLRAVNEAFAASPYYFASILLLSENRTGCVLPDRTLIHRFRAERVAVLPRVAKFN